VASKVSICNQALVRIGVETITSLTENSEQARLCNAIFDQSLDFLLQLFPWSFALTRASLAQSTTGPLYEWSYAYQLPTSPYCLRIVSVENDEDYRKEGRMIYTNAATLNIKYIKRVTDINELSSAFIEVMVLYVASQLALPMTANTSMSNSLEVKYQLSINKARLTDSQESPAYPFVEGSWITARTQ
jgi:hypothetical protein